VPCWYVEEVVIYDMLHYFQIVVLTIRTESKVPEHLLCRKTKLKNLRSARFAVRGGWARVALTWISEGPLLRRNLDAGIILVLVPWVIIYILRTNIYYTRGRGKEVSHSISGLLPPYGIIKNTVYVNVLLL